MRLFDVPDSAVQAAAEPPFPCGGIGGGHFIWDDEGRFRGWRLHPGEPEVDAVLPDSYFHVWFRSLDQTCSSPLIDHAVAESRRLFPLTWRRYEVETYHTGLVPPILESVSFSPLLPEESPERSLPIHVVEFRAKNPTDAPMEVALLLNWKCGSPDPWEEVEYDFQHDNLCLTGSMGPSSAANRQGIAVPDLHYLGSYEQGVHPWQDVSDVIDEFGRRGELHDSTAFDMRETAAGAGAWLKFTLKPGETKEAPFVLAWHLPIYESGPAKGLPRAYTQHLGRFRPDNAIVWLAEQAFQHFGAETANYKYWLQEIRDWQDASGKGAALNGLSELLGADVSWSEERGLEIVDMPAEARKRPADGNVLNAWPDLGVQTDLQT